MGKLRGIVLTPELRSLIDTVLALPQRQQPSSVSSSSAAAAEGGDSSSSSSASAPSRGTGNDVGEKSSSSSSLESARGAKRELISGASSYPGAGGAASAVRAAILRSDDGGALSSSSSSSLSLAGLDPIRFLIDNSSPGGTTSSSSSSEEEEEEEEDGRRARLRGALEGAVRRAGLSFAPAAGGGGPASAGSSPPPGGDGGGGGGSDPAFERRLERLRLRDEERSYMKLTTNLKTHSSLRDDDVTVKSMMYAASIGLNMIVAPVTFGVFMYFFAGGVFGRFFDEDPPGEGDADDDSGRRGGGRVVGGGVDVRRVIAGVVSGVFMLFVEMILFVIRSHELDASVTKKSRRRENRANPFGYTEKSMARVYVRED